MKKTAFPLLILSLLLAACQPAPASPADDRQQAMSEPATPPEDEAPAFTGTSTEIDKNESSITFTGKSNIINHDGGFRSFDVTVTPDATEPANFEKAQIEANITINSVYADNEGVSGHLKREDFFDAAQHPTATFTSTAIAAQGGNDYAITGNLTIKGHTEIVTMDAVVTDDSINISYDLPRQTFGVGNDSYGDKLLDPLVPVDIDLTFVE